MLDFNKRKRILKKLSDTAEKNVLLLIPCLIAAGLVKLFYYIVCNIDIALSDKDGNFLGIKSREKQSRRRKDDIVYVKRGFMPRMLSLVLSFALVMMFVPTVFPSIQSFADTIWSYTSTADSIFVSTDDESVVYDINIPFDRFKAPEIISVSDIQAQSCIIKWDPDAYFSDAGGLPLMFVYTESPSVLRSRSDGIIDSIEVWAYKTAKDGHIDFVECKIDDNTKNNFTNLNSQKVSSLKRGNGEIKVVGLDPDAEYSFILRANQQWVGYTKSGYFENAYTLDDYLYKGTTYKTPTDNAVTYTYLTKYKDTCIIDREGNYRVIDEPDEVNNYDPAILYEGKTAAQTYLPGHYKDMIENKNPIFTYYNAITSKSKLETKPLKRLTIPYYSTRFVSIQSRTLDDVQTFAGYEHKPSGEDVITLKLASDPPENVKAFLIYRSDRSGNNQTYELIGKQAVDSASLNRETVIFTDSTRNKPPVQPTTKYLYYLVPVTWNGDNSIGNYNDKTAGQFITGSIPSTTSGNQNIDEKAAEVYTYTGTPQNFVLTQNGVEFVLSWNPVTNATGYILERQYKYGSDPYSAREVLKTLDANATQYVDNKIAFDTDYIYYLTAVNMDNDDPIGQKSEPARTEGRLSMDALDAPYDITGKPGDNYAVLTWKCNDSKAVGFDIQYIRTDTLKEVTSNVKNKAIADVVNNHPEVTWGTDTDSKYSYIMDNFSSEYRNIYNTYFDELFTANVQDEISKRVEEVAVQGQPNLYSYTIHNLTPDVEYSFRIRSYVLTADPSNPNNFVKRPTSLYQPYYPEGYHLTITTPFDPPNNVKAVTKDGNITVTWDPVDTATGYELTIKRYDKNSKLISTTIENLTDTRYELKGLRAGDLYTFTVKATKRISGQIELKKTEASNMAYAVVGNPILKVTDLKAVLVDDVVQLTWTAAKTDFTGYYLYITNRGSTIRKDLTDNKYTHTDVQYGETYSYYVIPYRAVVLSDGLTQYFEGDKSNVETITIGGTVGTPADLKVTPGDRQIMLDWSDVKNASGYVVYVTSNGKTETFNVTKSEFLHTGLTPGQVYSYYVIAYRMINNVPVYGSPSVTISAVPDGGLPAPLDFNVTTNENSAILSWSKVNGATGYTVYGSSDTGKKLEIDVSKNSYVHTGLTEGEVWSYYVVAYKLVNNQKIVSDKTTTISVKIGASYPPPSDLVATPGNRTVALKWTKSKGVDGYIVYVYDENTGDFQPLSIVSKPTYQHTGLKNGKKYTYMVAGYKFVNGVRVIGDYSLAVSAIPTAGNAADVDYTINIKGTAPYGITHSELISAAANHEAFDDPVDAYFSVNDESTRAVKEVLRNYANGLKSFIVYPFDISLYLENTLIEVEPNEGFNITFTVPVPDVMKDYRDYITVVHLKDDGTEVIDNTVSDNIFVQSTDLEVLPSAIVDVGGIWCVQFTTASCSPFAFVIYKDNLEDVKSGSGTASSSGYSGSLDTGVFLITVLPDILPIEKKTKFVERTKKRYRIKK